MGSTVPIHIAWYLIWVVVIAGLLFMIVHALYVGIFAKPKKFAKNDSPASAAVPERVPRHSFVARAFHWVMAISMFALLFTAFLPKVGVKFDWVTYHWIAGLVLTASIIFHIFHASFFLDFWSIWPDKIDLRDAAAGCSAPSASKRRRPIASPSTRSKTSSITSVILLSGLAVICTGVFMMKRVNTFGIFTRNPYVFGDMTWGMMYVLHGLAGVGLIALIMVHVYFGIRPEKLPITKSMIFGYMSKDFYLEEHDPQRWAAEKSSPSQEGYAPSDAD